MNFNSNQFIVRWQDKNSKDREKLYDNYDDATKAYKWLVGSGAGSVDLAIIKRVKPASDDVDEKMGSLPYRD